MLRFKQYARPDTMEEVWKINQGRANVVLGGCGWLKMGSRTWNQAIDLSALGLDKIEEDEHEFRIGAMVTLRQLETNYALNNYTNNAVHDCVVHIVGIQFRNCATVGGTIWGRYGFSDVLTCLMALDAEVELYQGGRIPLVQFAEMKPDNDIIMAVIIKKTQLKVAYDSFRNTETDFPVLTVAIAIAPEGYRACIGARPARSLRVLAVSEEELLDKIDHLTYGTNTRASGEYRQYLAQVLAKRCMTQCKGGANE